MLRKDRCLDCMSDDILSRESPLFIDGIPERAPVFPFTRYSRGTNMVAFKQLIPPAQTCKYFYKSSLSFFSLSSGDTPMLTHLARKSVRENTVYLLFIRDITCTTVVSGGKH